MGVGNRVENMDEEGNCSIGKVLQCPIRDTVRTRSLANVETTDGLVINVRGD